MSEQNALNSTPRIRCTYCNRRIAASSVVCPNCQRNPRAFYWKRQHVVLLLGVLALVLGGAAFYFSNDLKALLPSGIALSATTTPPASVSRTPVAVVIVATNPPPSATRLPPTATRALTPTPRPTESPTVPTTPTRVPTNAPNTTPQPSETPSPIPTAIPVNPPQLVSPGDTERISGSNKVIVLTFQPAQPLANQEWFRVQVDFLDRAGNPVSWCSFTRNSSLEFPREFFDDSSPNVRSFLWRVGVIHSNQFNPSTCDAPYEILSAPTDPRTFYWY